MNIALEQTKEYVDGKMRRNYGDAFVRGNNGTLECTHGNGQLKLMFDPVMYISADS